MASTSFLTAVFRSSALNCRSNKSKDPALTFWEAAHQDELLPQKKRKGDWDNADRGMDSGSGKRNGLCDP